MVSHTPNSDHLDQFIGDIEERFKYAKLKDWPLEKLYGEEFLLRNEFERYKATFPHKKSM